MKKIYFCATKIFLVTLFFWGNCQEIKSQTLSAGDILFTGYLSNASTTDSFSFVVLVNMPAGTTISFTDNGWLSTNALRVGEQTITFTSSITLPAGSEVSITGPSAGAGTATARVNGTTVSAGTCSGSIPSLATSGDQVIAYQGTSAAPTLIAGIHMNVYSTDLGQCGNTTTAGWDPTCIVDNANFSRIPGGLAPNFSTIWIGTEGIGASEQDNAVFNCTGPLSTVAQIRTAVTNPANWNANSVAPPNLTFPSGCSFLVVTAAGSRISGRATAADGRGLANVLVKLTGQSGAVRETRTSPFGYYTFDGVSVGETYSLSASSKSYTFASRAVTILDELSNFDLVAAP